MNRLPDFDELMEGVESQEERARLRRVHELLLDAGPPPELSPAIASVTVPEARRFRFARRRLVGAVALAGTVVAAGAIGFVAGDSSSDDSAMPVRDTVALTGDGDATGAVSLGYKDSDGNWPMVIRVEGLAPLRGGDYYTLALTKDGKAVVTCGTFNVGDRSRQTIRMSAAYNLDRYDGWVVNLYDAETHDDTPVLWTTGDISA